MAHKDTYKMYLHESFLRAIKQSGWNEVADAVTASEKLLEARRDFGSWH